jgi:hypothetical protein
VHDAAPENDPELSLPKLTDPPGVLVAPGALSLTLAVHLVDPATSSDTGAHATVVLVERTGTTKQPENADVLKRLALPGCEEGSAVVLVADAVTISPGASCGDRLALKLALPDPSVVVSAEPSSV